MYESMDISAKASLLKWRFQPFSLDKSMSIRREKRTFLALETLSNYENQLKGVSSLKSSLIRCLNHWILTPTLVSGNYDYRSRKGRFLIEMERTFGRVDSDSAREPSDVTSFGNVTAFFIFPFSCQL